MSQPESKPIGDGGPAFPCPGGNEGMTLLDWFAGQMMPHVYNLAQTTNRAALAKQLPAGTTIDAFVAGQSYELAEAMIAEKQRRASK